MALSGERAFGPPGSCALGSWQPETAAGAGADSTMTEVIFFVAAIGAIGGALGVVMLQNPFYSVLALVGHLLSLAALFLLLRAEFVAAAQVVVYAGAVMGLYVFVVAYGGGAAEPLQNAGQGLRIAAPLFAGVLRVEL